MEKCETKGLSPQSAWVSDSSLGGQALAGLSSAASMPNFTGEEQERVTEEPGIKEIAVVRLEKRTPLFAP